MSTHNTFTATFKDVAVAALQDLFSLVVGANSPVTILFCSISQQSDYKDAEEEGLLISIVRGNGTVGSGGSAPTIRKNDTKAGAAVATVRANDTTMMATNATARPEGTPSPPMNVAVPLMNAPSLFGKPASIVFQSRYAAVQSAFDENPAVQANTASRPSSDSPIIPP